MNGFWKRFFYVGLLLVSVVLLLKWPMYRLGGVISTAVSKYPINDMSKEIRDGAAADIRRHDPIDYIRSNKEFVALLKRTKAYDKEPEKLSLMHRNTVVPVRFDDIDGPLPANPTRGRITVRFRGRMGNNIFQYNALYVAAIRHGMTIVLSRNCAMAKTFKLSATLVNESHPGKNWALFIAYHPHFYDRRIEHLDSRKDIEMQSTYMDFKYWIDHPEVMKEYAFVDRVEEEANRFLHQILRSRAKNNGVEVVLIGVHIRRTDLITLHLSIGWKAYGSPYLLAARQYMEGVFSSKQIIFVICSDDIKWSKTHFSGGDHQVVFSEGHDMSVDFAILTKTNHTIQTIGSFGRWAATINGGIVVYRGHEKMARMDQWKDYYKRYKGSDVYWKGIDL